MKKNADKKKKRWLTVIYMDKEGVFKSVAIEPGNSLNIKSTSRMIFLKLGAAISNANIAEGNDFYTFTLDANRTWLAGIKEYRTSGTIRVSASSGSIS